MKSTARGCVGAAAAALVGGLAVPATAASPPALEHGPDVRVTGDVLDLSGTTGGGAAPDRSSPTGPLCDTQATPTLTRVGSRLVAAWLDDKACDHRAGAATDRPGQYVPFSMTAWSTSDDGGQTWAPRQLLRGEALGFVLGDPVLATDRVGRVFLASRATHPLDAADRYPEPVPDTLFDNVRRAEGRPFVGVAVSGDAATTFGRPVDASGTDGTREDGYDQDRPWLAVDTGPGSPHVDTVYVAWTQYETREPGLPDALPGVVRTVRLARSTDHGASYSTPVDLATGVAGPDSTSLEGVGVQVVVGPSGEVYVLWAAERSGLRSAPVDLVMTRSLDGGRTFNAPSVVASVTAPGRVTPSCLPPGSDRVPLAEELDPDASRQRWVRVVPGDIRVFSWPSLAVDLSDGPHRGRLYLAVAGSDVDEPAFPAVLDQQDLRGDVADVFLLRSDDGGVSWLGTDADGRARVEVGESDAAFAGDEFNPQVAVDADGNVAVSYYRRPVDGPFHRFVGRVSADGGATFGPVALIGDLNFLTPRNRNPFNTSRLVTTAAVSLVDRTSGVGGPARAGALPDDEASRPPIRGGWGRDCASLGEYSGLVGTGRGTFVAAWADARGTGTPLTEDRQVRYAPDLDVFVDRLTVRP